MEYMERRLIVQDDACPTILAYLVESEYDDFALDLFGALAVVMDEAGWSKERPNYDDDPSGDILAVGEFCGLPLLEVEAYEGVHEGIGRFFHTGVDSRWRQKHDLPAPPRDLASLVHAWRVYAIETEGLPSSVAKPGPKTHIEFAMANLRATGTRHRKVFHHFCHGATVGDSIKKLEAMLPAEETKP